MVSRKARQVEATEYARWTDKGSCTSRRCGSSLAGKISTWQQRVGEKDKGKNMKQERVKKERNKFLFARKQASPTHYDVKNLSLGQSLKWGTVIDGLQETERREREREPLIERKGH